MKRFYSYLSAALSILVLAVGLLPSSVSAAGSSGLSITPRKNYIIEAGKSITDKLTIGNLDTKQDLFLSLKMIDFTYSNQSGTPKLNLAANAAQTPWSLKSFSSLPQNLVVPHSSSKTVSFTITIPKNQGAGSYYSAIYYQAGGGSGGNVALNASGVTLVFVSVPGTVHESMSLQKFGAYNSKDNGVTGAYTFIDINDQPRMIAYTLKNEGNVFESPAGSVVIKDMFGHQVANVSTNSAQSLALLGQTRLFTSCIKTVQQKIKFEGGTSNNTSCVDPGLRPGRYTASLDVFYGQNGNQTHEITAVASFWYLPLWFLILLAIVLAVLGFGIWWLQRKLRTVVRGTTYKAARKRRR